MIPQPQLDTLKRLIKAAAPPPLIVAPMDARGSRFQLSTPRPGARIVGTAFTKADAECMAALWQWGALLIADLEQTVEVAKHYRTIAQQVEQIHEATPKVAAALAGTGAITMPKGRRHSPGRVAST